MYNKVSMYVCMYLCMYVCIYVCMYEWVYVSMNIYYIYASVSVAAQLIRAAQKAL